MPKSEKYKLAMSAVRAKIAAAKRRGIKQGSNIQVGFFRQEGAAYYICKWVDRI